MSEARLFVVTLMFLLLEVFAFVGTSSVFQNDFNAWAVANGSAAPTPPAGAVCDWWNVACVAGTTAGAIGYAVQAAFWLAGKVLAIPVLLFRLVADLAGLMFSYNVFITAGNVFVMLGFGYSMIHGLL